MENVMPDFRSVDMGALVADFYALYREDENLGITMVKEYVKNYDIPEIELIVYNQREVARNMKDEANILSPMKLAFFMLLAVACVANYVMMGSNTWVYVMLFFALFIPAMDSHSMAQKYLAHKVFADIIESEMAFFKDYRALVEEREIEKMTEERNKKTKSELF